MQHYYNRTPGSSAPDRNLHVPHSADAHSHSHAPPHHAHAHSHVPHSSHDHGAGAVGGGVGPAAAAAAVAGGAYEQAAASSSISLSALSAARPHAHAVGIPASAATAGGSPQHHDQLDSHAPHKPRYLEPIGVQQTTASTIAAHVFGKRASAETKSWSSPLSSERERVVFFRALHLIPSRCTVKY